MITTNCATLLQAAQEFNLGEGVPGGLRKLRSANNDIMTPSFIFRGAPYLCTEEEAAAPHLGTERDGYRARMRNLVPLVY